jgi:DNA repair protein RecO (recombination protein O)
MPLYSADALILRTYKLGEADRIVVFLTRDRGKKRGVAKGARRPESNFLGALEPLTHARVAYFEKEQRELVNLNYSERALGLSSGTIEALGCAAYFAELIDEWAPRATRTSGCTGSARRWWSAGRRRAAEPLIAVLRVLAAEPAGRVSAGRVPRLSPKRRRFWRRRERRARRAGRRAVRSRECCASSKGFIAA